MHVLQVRNVHEALPRGIRLLHEIGVPRESRNGPVLYGGQVSTVYEHPEERVIFWPERDANPFFHLYEALWMLAGRNDVEPLCRYIARSIDYSDDGVTQHGAYGHRWRYSLNSTNELYAFNKLDQLQIIAIALQKNPDDRRCVLQMWDARRDLGQSGKDFPCNTMASFQVDGGKLHLTVFCRSNDIVWGAYGANAVQFGTLLEYMALWTGYEIGTYTQVSVNWHGYISTIKPLENLLPDRAGYVRNPYAFGEVHHIPMAADSRDINFINTEIHTLLSVADGGFQRTIHSESYTPWAAMVYAVLKAHHIYKTTEDDSRFSRAMAELERANPHSDWVVAAREWIERRRLKKLMKLQTA